MLWMERETYHEDEAVSYICLRTGRVLAVHGMAEHRREGCEPWSTPLSGGHGLISPNSDWVIGNVSRRTILRHRLVQRFDNGNEDHRVIDNTKPTLWRSLVGREDVLVGTVGACAMLCSCRAFSCDPSARISSWIILKVPYKVWSDMKGLGN